MNGSGYWGALDIIECFGALDIIEWFGALDIIEWFGVLGGFRYVWCDKQILIFFRWLRSGGDF